ncbi:MULTISPECIES: hypothetical protein [Acinetobacter]|uniref:hypothetical protein n=1 Tax=Acinetobacter TaxID=469 RepID=UPI001F2BE194|nr:MULTISPECIES: hypothetical protein [Acinetobacter]MDV2483315.1 hypothetical protein [Acinetobacter towneri]UIZ56319.1 hypothetical protein LZP46_07730 [Acinetobacter sp. SCLZS86]
MGGFVLGVIVILILWAFFSAKSKADSSQAFDAFDEAKFWFDRQGIVKNSVKFNSYTDKYLAKTHGIVIILVGIGEKVNGEHVGFAIEVKEGQGVVESTLIEPAGIATHDKKAVLIAKQKGKSLIDALQELALHHRLNNVR